MMDQFELLAPAGDLVRAKVAFDYGADAVFVGGKRFSLRSRASNFEIQDIKEAADYGHAMGKKLFVTVNMIPHEEDLEGLEAYLHDLYHAGVDAIIVASLAIAKKSKELHPDMEVHLSTQLSITNHKTIAFYHQFGIDRVVLARELSLDSFKEVIEKSPVPIEVFIHGGMCVNYSGRCTLSNDMTLRDANRGGCAQSCRWSYDLYDGDVMINQDHVPFSMSSKDLMVLDEIKDMMEAKVYSFKIEGRMKSAYYIAVIVKAYRRWIDALLAGTADEALYEQIRQELKLAESRPTFNGFLRAIPDKNGHSYTPKAEGVNQSFVGTVLKKDGAYILVEMRNKVEQGEVLECFSHHDNNQRFAVDEMLDENKQLITSANRPMSKVWMKCPCDVEVNDFLRRNEFSV